MDLLWRPGAGFVAGIYPRKWFRFFFFCRFHADSVGLKRWANSAALRNEDLEHGSVEYLIDREGKGVNLIPLCFPLGNFVQIICILQFSFMLWGFCNVFNDNFLD